MCDFYLARSSMQLLSLPSFLFDFLTVCVTSTLLLLGFFIFYLWGVGSHGAFCLPLSNWKWNEYLLDIGLSRGQYFPIFPYDGFPGGLSYAWGLPKLPIEMIPILDSGDIVSFDIWSFYFRFLRVTSNLKCRKCNACLFPSLPGALLLPTSVSDVTFDASQKPGRHFWHSLSRASHVQYLTRQGLSLALKFTHLLPFS